MSRRIATLWDNKNSDDNDREHSHPGSQAFYAGGSEHSGQQILGPSRDAGREQGRLVENLFNLARQSAVSSSSTGPPSGANSLVITFWRNGFTVGDNSELRDYNSPANRDFLECLKRGETPQELSSRVSGGFFDVKLDNKAGQDYEPKKTFQAFSGQGQRLGAPTPETVDSQKSSAADGSSAAK